MVQLSLFLSAVTDEGDYELGRDPIPCAHGPSELLKSATLIGLGSKLRGSLITAQPQIRTLELYRDVKLLAPCINAVGVDTEKNLGY